MKKLLLAFACITLPAQAFNLSHDSFDIVNKRETNLFLLGALQGAIHGAINRLGERISDKKNHTLLHAITLLTAQGYLLHSDADFAVRFGHALAQLITESILPKKDNTFSCEINSSLAITCGQYFWKGLIKNDNDEIKKEIVLSLRTLQRECGNVAHEVKRLVDVIKNDIEKR